MHYIKRALLPLDLQFFAGDDGGAGGGGETKTLLNQLTAEVKNAQTQLTQALEKQNSEIKKFGTTTDQTVNQVKEFEGKYEGLIKDLDELKGSVNDFAKKFGRPGAGGNAEEIKTAGQMFIENEHVKNMMASGEPQRGVHIDVKSFHKKDLTSAASGVGNGGALITPYRVPEIVEAAQRRLTIRDLLNTTPITSNAVEFVREVGFTNNAAIRPEKAAAAQSEIEYEIVTTGVKTISHFMPATREVLADVPRLRGIIDNKLVYGVQIKEENQLLYGDGLNGSLTGFMNDSDVQNIGEITAGASLNAIDWIRRSMTRAIVAGYPATGTILNPYDWEAIELAKGDDGHYLWVNIATGNGQQLFKVPVIVTPAMQEKDFITGAFGLGATLYDREQATIRFSESHSDYFTRGMVAILAEERVALTIERPEAFVKGKLTTATA